MGLFGKNFDGIFNSDNSSNEEENVEEIEYLEELISSGDIEYAHIYWEVECCDEVDRVNRKFGIKCLNNATKSKGYYLLGDAYLKKVKDYEKALVYIQRALSICPKSNLTYSDCLSDCLYDMYLIHKHIGNIADARRYIFEAYMNARQLQPIDVEQKWRNEFDSTNNEYTTKYLELPYQNRRVLLLVKSITSLNQDSITILDINSDLSRLTFPIGHPKANEVYVAHPLKTNHYMPIEYYQLELIEERVREFCVLVQSLGATEINIKCKNDNTDNSTNSGNQNIAGGMSNDYIDIHGSRYSEYSRRLIEEISKSISLHQTFQPQKAPTLPNNLLWYEGEPSWKHLYRQRMEDGLLSHEESIATKKSQIVDNREMKEIKGELKSLFADMDVAFNKTEEAKFEQQENAVFAISVKFAPLSQLTGNTTPTPNDKMFSANEQKYIDEVKECLADGEITKTGRRLLNMHRERLGISESRAAELEASVTTPQLTDEEKEYLEAYQEANENGQVSDKERRMLNHIRNILGISEERAKEIEY